MYSWLKINLQDILHTGPSTMIGLHIDLIESLNLTFVAVFCTSAFNVSHNLILLDIQLICTNARLLKLNFVITL